MIFDKVKKLCDDRGISIRQLEINAGIGNGVVSGWKESIPMSDTLRKVAKALNVTVDELLKEETT